MEYAERLTVPLRWWVQGEIAEFNEGRPAAQRLRSHDFRRRAMTEAVKAGFTVDQTAAAEQPAAEATGESSEEPAEGSSEDAPAEGAEKAEQA